MLRTAIFKIALALWFTLWSPILLLGLVSARASRRFVLWDAAGVLWLARIINGIKIEMTGRAARPAIVASKHMSILEVAALATTTPAPFFIIKRELMWIPIYGWAFWRMGFIGVNRARGATNMKALADQAAQRIRKGGTLIIFPEGTRAKPGNGVKLKRGLLFIAEAAKIGIQPVGVTTGLFWPKRGRMSGGVAKITFEPPLPFNASLDEVAASIARNSA